MKDAISLHYTNCIGVNTTDTVNSRYELAMTINNMLYWGCKPDQKLLTALLTADLFVFNSRFNRAMTALKGDASNIIDGVVYKNFPIETQDMSENDYWVRQILMYCGMSKDYFTQEEKVRPLDLSKYNLTQISVADDDAIANICHQLAVKKAKWNVFDTNTYLAYGGSELSNIVFIENRITAALHSECELKTLGNWTNILRYYAALSDGDVRLATSFKFVSLSNAKRRELLQAFEDTYTLNANDDADRHRTHFLLAFKMLHVGQYAKRYPNTFSVASALREGKLQTFERKIEHGLSSADETTLVQFALYRPKLYIRQLNRLTGLFAHDAVADNLVVALKRLSVYDIISLDAYLGYVGKYDNRIIAPNGIWNKSAIHDTKNHISETAVQLYRNVIKSALADRLHDVVVKSDLRCLVGNITLPKNVDVVNESNHNLGTRIPIGNNINHLRYISHWQGDTTIWFDIGVSLFNTDFTQTQVCTWNVTNSTIMNFSGDPVIGYDDGIKNATQMIDLDIDKSIDEGYRYALTTVLCYSKVTFSDHADKFNAPRLIVEGLEDSEKGFLREPKRDIVNFELKTKAYTSYVCVVDLYAREIIHIDLDLGNYVSSIATALDSQYMIDRIKGILQYVELIPTYGSVLSHIPNYDSELHASDDHVVVESIDDINNLLQK